MGEYALGQSVPRSEDPRLLKGGGSFVDDQALHGMVHGIVLRSTHAHAKLRHVDVSEAAKAPGILAVLTGNDWQALGWGDVPGDPPRKLRDGSLAYRPPYPALVLDRARHVGDPIVFIIGETEMQARDAAELVIIDYEPLPAITDTEKALLDGMPLVWPDAPNNIAFVHLLGDKTATDTAFDNAHIVVGEKFVINRVAPAPIEPRAALGHYDSAEDRYTLYTTLQHANPYRMNIAEKVIGVAESKVRVISGDVGGSYGMKSSVYNESVLVLWASMVTRRPVKWRSERTEAFQSDAQGRDNVTQGELALDENGNFLGMRVKIIGALGAYVTQAAGGPLTVNLGTLAGVYKTPAIHVDVTAVYTNTTITRPYRGAGRPEAAYVIERLVELAADKIGVDPTELRRRNTIAPAAMPFQTGLTFKYDCGLFEANMDMALDMANYSDFCRRRKDARSRGKLLGIGISNTIERAAAPGFEGGEIRFNRSGTATVLSGAINQGQGHETVFKQLVCDRLGLEFDETYYTQGDTDLISFGQGTGGSRSATIGGSALLLASDKIIQKARQIAAHLLEAAVADIDFEEGVFSIAGTDRRITIKEVAKAAAVPGKLPSGLEPGLNAQAVYNATEMNFPNGCHVVEVEIDRETGAVDVITYNVVDDVGTVMNPALLKGQIQGGVGQGLGQALMEDLCYDAGTGQNLTSSFLDYAIPRADDFSAINVKSNPVPTETNPLGVKGAGEAGNVGALPAVSNAVVDALSEFGVTHIEMPATSERVWQAINKLP